MTIDQIKELAGHRDVSPWVIKLVQDAVEIERERVWGEKDWGQAAKWIREDEREACAKVCDVIGADMSHPYVANNCAAAIRARGEK